MHSKTFGTTVYILAHPNFALGALGDGERTKFTSLKSFYYAKSIFEPKGATFSRGLNVFDPLKIGKIPSFYSQSIKWTSPKPRVLRIVLRILRRVVVLRLRKFLKCTLFQTQFLQNKTIERSLIQA